MTYTTSGGHDWAEDDNGSINAWVLEYGYHNGPGCKACSESVCEHCEPDWREQKCPMVLDGSATPLEVTA